MTKTEYDKLFNELLNDVKKAVEKRSQSLVNSGAIDFEKYEDNYLLPKIVLTACLKDLCDSYMPFTDSARKEVFNLMKF